MHLPTELGVSGGRLRLWVAVMMASGQFALITGAQAAAADREGSDEQTRWTFDTVHAEHVMASDGVRDPIGGNLTWAAGVKDRAGRFDGFTSAVVREAQSAPRLGSRFSFEAWIALQAYPWGWCPIITQRDGQEAGYYFGVDARGRVGLHVAINGKWVECNSQAAIPLLTWTHVAGTFDGSAGMAVYINGQQAGQLAVSGSPSLAPGADLLIGRNPDKQPVMFSAAWGATDQPMHFTFDGLMDEVILHQRCLTLQEIEKSYAAMRPNDSPPPLQPHRLPSGPPQASRFGAFYERLRYDSGWDALWRSSGPDVVVGFEHAPVRLVFWRGTSYVPCWVTERGNWITNEFMERGSDRKKRGCSEPMSDKRADYSHVKILENSDARAVVYWRYAPVGVDYVQAYPNPETGWSDWAEEYHTVYPDGVAVRKVVMYSTDFKPWHEWCQTIEVLHPNQRPDDVFDEERILAVANMRGESKRFGWEPGARSYRLPTLAGANMQITYLNSQFNPFLILDDRQGKNDRGGLGPDIHRTGGDGWSEHSRYPWWNHWPVTPMPILERQAQAADRPSHSCTSTQYSAAYETAPGRMVKIMLCGMTDQPIEGLLPLAKSWLRPAEATLDSATSTAYEYQGYDPTERAYRISCRNPRGTPLRLRFAAGPDSPLVNPAIVLRDWGEHEAAVSLSQDQPIKHNVRCGHIRRLDGADAVVWIEVQTESPLQVTFTPK